MPPPPLDEFPLVQLRGAAISILVAMCLPKYRGTNVTIGVLKRATGVKSDVAIKDGLALLGDYGYVVRVGQLGQGGADVWALTADCPNLLPEALLELSANPTLQKNLVASPVSSRSLNNLNIDSLTTTTNLTLQKNLVALQETGLPEPETPASASPPIPPAPRLDPDVARLAALLHQEHGTVMRYALEACQNALADGSPILTELNILYWAEYLLENSSGVRNRPALVSLAVGRGEAPPNWWLEKFKPTLADADVYEYSYDALTTRQQRIVDLEFERKALAQVVEENATPPAEEEKPDA